MRSTGPAGRRENSTKKGSQDTERMEASRRKTSATGSQEQGIKDECLSRRLRQSTDWNKA